MPARRRAIAAARSYISNQYFSLILSSYVTHATKTYMKTMTVREVICLELLKQCKATTDKLRGKTQKKKRKYSEKQIEEVRAQFGVIGWKQPHVDAQMKALAILHKAPELERKAFEMSPLAIVIMACNPSGHNYHVGQPHIVTVTSGETFTCLHANGEFGPTSVSVPHDRPRLATEKEIEQCIHALTEQQLRTICVQPLFKPVIDAALRVKVQHDSPDEPAVTNGEADATTTVGAIAAARATFEEE